MVAAPPAVAAVPLQDLNLVAVRVLDEEEPRHQAAVAVKFLNRLRADPGLAEPRVQAVEVVDAERDVAVALAVGVGLGPPLVQGQLDLEVGLRVAQVDQGEAVEVEPVGNVQAERRAIERNRPVEVEHADHQVDGLGHREGSLLLPEA
jgi:hypothetical protein